MPEYQVVVCDRLGVPIDELPDAVVEKVTWKLSDVGAATINIKQDDPRVAVPLLLENEVQIYIEGWPDLTQVPWWGVWWRDRQDASKCAFECQSLESYFAKRFIDTASLYWVDGGGVDLATEQLVIGWGLVNYAQTGTDKNLNITASAYGPSGITRLRRYDRSEHPNIGDELRKFAGLVDFTTGALNGFDYHIQGMRSGARLWTPHYPQRGSLKADLMLEYGKNMPSYEVDEDAVNLVTKAYNTGGSTGDTKLEAVYRDDVASAKYGEMLGITSNSEQKDPDTLADGARAFVAPRNKPILTPKVNAVRIPEELLGTIMPGDTVPISIHRGRTNIEDTMRVSEVTWSPGKSALELSFIPRIT